MGHKSNVLCPEQIVLGMKLHIRDKQQRIAITYNFTNRFPSEYKADKTEGNDEVT
jgi:hypothetical protein